MSAFDGLTNELLWKSITRDTMGHRLVGCLNAPRAGVSALAGWLARLPAVVPPGDVNKLADAAAIPSTWHRAPMLEPVALSAFLALRDDVVRSRSRRRGWVVALVLAVPVAYFVMWNLLLAFLAG